MKQITIKDIAKEAGVSITTVSHVINKNIYVSDELTQRVNKIILKYNYRKDFIASSLRQRRTKMIGIIIPDITNPELASISRGLQLTFYKKGYISIVCNSDYNYKNEIDFMEELSSRKIDGFIIIPSIEENKLFETIDAKLPMVIINRKIDRENTDFIMIESYKSLIEIINYLVNLGHKKIAYINREQNLYQSKLRFEGYLEGLKKNNLKFDSSLVSNSSGFSIGDGYADMEKFLELENKPTAVIAYNDVLAAGIVEAIKNNKLKVPEDFSIVGFGNTFIGRFLEPKLTTIEASTDEIVSNSVQLLLSRIQKKVVRSRIVNINRSLVIRESTGRVKS
jgi:DNA-binding LacI/PurR family transcriptional regulator